MDQRLKAVDADHARIVMIGEVGASRGKCGILILYL